jgi:G3E family GTPase
MHPTRFVLIGGFLGAGKTTTIARLARTYVDRALKVGIVTNDQATDLVDTHTLRSAGFGVGEVAGSCFCCNFNGLTDVVAQLTAREPLDVIFAEPVGSCTDIMATVVRPLRQMYPDRFDLAPYGVILKPSHGRRILRNEPNTGFSPKAAYIFRKQLEEADFVIVNRIDELAPAEVEELVGLLHAQYPGVPTIRVSARTGQGFAALLEILDQRGEFGQRTMELDYDVYAEGEAELGWLNSSVRVTASAPFSLDDLSLGIVQRLQQSLSSAGAEPAHLKTFAQGNGHYSVVNLVSGDTPPVVSIASSGHARQANVIVNARVAIDPSVLQDHVTAGVRATCQAINAVADFLRTQSFRPGRPNPTYRITSPS